MKGLENPLLPVDEGGSNSIPLKTVKKTNETKTTSKPKSLRQLVGGPNVSWFSDRHLLARKTDSNPANRSTDVEEQLAEPRSKSDKHIRERKKKTGLSKEQQDWLKAMAQNKMHAFVEMFSSEDEDEEISAENGDGDGTKSDDEAKAAPAAETRPVSPHGKPPTVPHFPERLRTPNKEVSPRQRRHPSNVDNTDAGVAYVPKPRFSSSVIQTAASGTTSKRNTSFNATNNQVVFHDPMQWRTTESHDVSNFESAVEVLHNANWNTLKLLWLDVKRWLLIMIVAVIVAMISFGISWSTRILNYLKFDVMCESMIELEKEGEVWVGSTFFCFLGFNLACILIACLLVVYGEKVAAGSGIPEIKCILNGVKIPHAARFKTLIVKVLGVTFTVGSGLPAGKEGPMIHAGGIVGSGISQGKSTTLNCDTSFTKAFDFRNDGEKRDFIACGAAAGIAAAFGAPIGGVLFCLEEGTSWWHPALTWRTFLCALVATTLVTFTITGITDEGLIGNHIGQNISSAGVFADAEIRQGNNYQFYEIFIFISMGLIAGNFFAIFNYCHMKIVRLRKAKIHTSNCRRIVEALSISALVSAISFGVPFFCSQCFDLPDEEFRVEDTIYQEFYCEHGQFSHLATFFFSPAESVLKQLYYSVNDDPGLQDFEPRLIFLFFIVYSALVCVSFGLSVPAGVFIPTVLSGAAFGRLVGQMLQDTHMFPFAFDAGTYAIVGSAAALGGLSRMVISVTVIMVEATGELNLALPVMVTVISARWMGNVWKHCSKDTQGLYDSIIEGLGVPFLEWTAPHWFSRLQVHHVMHPAPLMLRTVERAGRVLQVLRESTCNGYPVVMGGRSEKRYRLNGLILRKQLHVLLCKENRAKVLHPADEKPPTTTGWNSDFLSNMDKTVSWSEFEKHYPRYPTLEAVERDFQPSEKEMWLDLSPYMGMPHSIQARASLLRSFQLFRKCSLRHLVVVNPEFIVVGMITRKNLHEEYCHHVLSEVEREQKKSVVERITTDARSARDYFKKVRHGSKRR